MDDRLDREYDSGLAFCYKCVMFVLKKEYPELNMSKLEAGVQEYMAEQGRGVRTRGTKIRSRLLQVGSRRRRQETHLWLQVKSQHLLLRKLLVPLCLRLQIILPLKLSSLIIHEFCSLCKSQIFFLFMTIRTFINL